MSAMKRHMNRQQDALAVIALAVLVVVLYSLWGASILNSQREAAAQSTSSAVASR